MKKVRIMLMSLLVLALVGGALAFKAKFQTEFCTALPTNGTCPSGKLCPNFIENQNVSGGDDVCTTVPLSGADEGNECKTSNSPTAANKPCVVNTTTAYQLEDNE